MGILSQKDDTHEVCGRDTQATMQTGTDVPSVWELECLVHQCVNECGPKMTWSIAVHKTSIHLSPRCASKISASSTTKLKLTADHYCGCVSTCNTLVGGISSSWFTLEFTYWCSSILNSEFCWAKDSVSWIRLARCSNVSLKAEDFSVGTSRLSWNESIQSLTRQSCQKKTLTVLSLQMHVKSLNEHCTLLTCISEARLSERPTCAQWSLAAQQGSAPSIPSPLNCRVPPTPQCKTVRVEPEICLTNNKFRCVKTTPYIRFLFLSSVVKYFFPRG